MTGRPRGRPDYGNCPACPGHFHLRADGTVGAHMFRTVTGRVTSVRCPGVGKLPRQADL